MRVMGKILLALAFTTSSITAHAIKTSAPEDNRDLAIEQGALLGGLISTTAAGFAPWPFGTIGEAAALGFDIGLRHTPPTLELPGDVESPHNSVLTDTRGRLSCHYAYPNLGFEYSVDSAFGIPLAGINKVFFSHLKNSSPFGPGYIPGTLSRPEGIVGAAVVDTLGSQFSSTTKNGFDGKLNLYHANASVQLKASNPYLNTNDEYVYFPEGHHNIVWNAESKINPIFDIGLPGVLIGLGSLAEYKIGQKITTSALKKGAAKAAVATGKYGTKLGTEPALRATDDLRSRFFAGPGKVAGKFGLLSLRSGESFAEFYNRTSYVGARNRGVQKLTVWDTSVPYFEDVHEYSRSYGQGVWTQDIVLEATDFGGVRLNRVRDYLRNQFVVQHDCEPIFPYLTNNEIAINNETVANDDLARIFPTGETSELTWEARDNGPFAPEFFLTNNYLRDGEGVRFQLQQNIQVYDTQPPLITVPGGFAYETSEAIEFDEISDFIGRPRIVDLADPRPTFERTELSSLEPDRRYEIYWTARDSSNNVSEPELQLITIKTPGTNTAPTANIVEAQETTTGELIEIELTGTDVDEIDGRVDPLNFEITAQPESGFLESPLYPHFIQDYRLSPVGDQEVIEDNEVVRTSPLQHLAEDFYNTLGQDHGTFLKSKICDAAADSDDPQGELNLTTFGGTVPVNFVYKPSYVQVDDDGFYYIRDYFWQCNYQREINTWFYRPDMSPIPRISKWDSDGNFIAMQELSPVEGKTYDPGTINYSFWPDDKFSFDEFGRIWISTHRRFLTLFGRPALPIVYTDYAFSDVRLLSIPSDFSEISYHGQVEIDFQDRFDGSENIGIAVDREREIYYDLRGWGFKPFELQNTDVLDSDTVVLGVDTGTKLTPDGYRLIPGCSEQSCYGSGRRDANYEERAATAIKVDSEGYVYILHRFLSRIYKFETPTEDDNGDWIPGDFIGWMGRCDANLQDGENEFYNACDEVNKVSRGFACTDQKCSYSASSGSGPGQFNLPEEFVFDDNDILYVADTGNNRVQRFGQDGTFAGEATSSGQGFVLGNFGTPTNLSVNSNNFFLLEADNDNFDYFLHVFKTLPFWDMTPSSATVRYRSEFGFIGDDSISYLVDDGLAKSDPVDVTLQVERAYNPPTDLSIECFNSESLDTEISCALDEDTQLWIRLSSFDRDGFLGADGLDQHEFIVETEPEHGELSVVEQYSSDNTIVYLYTPDEDYYGADTFSFYVLDEQDDSSLNLRSEATPEVSISVSPIPDRMEFDAPDTIQVPRGFRHFFVFPYFDVDDQDHSEFVGMSYGDGAFVSQTGEYRMPGSGHFDVEGREVDPLIDAANGTGVFLASHIFTDATADSLVISISNLDFDADTGTSEYTVETIPVEVVEVTRLEVESETYHVDPEQSFQLQFDVVNRRPEGWAGNVAPGVSIEFEIPAGLSLTAVTNGCSESTETTDDGPVDSMTCVLGDMNPDESLTLTFDAIAELETARDEFGFSLDVDLIDGSEKLRDNDFGQVIIEMNDRDGDEVLDVDDAFPDQADYTTDSDDDGMPDVWEERFGLNPDLASDASQDPDGDGRNNLAEFNAGNSPLAADDGAEINILNTLLDVGDVGEDWFGFRVAKGDFNGDGHMDIIASAPETTSGRGQVRVYYGDGAGNFDRDFNGGVGQPDRINGIANGSRLGSEIAVGDIDGNGYDDIVWALRRDGGGVTIEFSNENGIRQSRSEINHFTSALLVADVDGDGLDDVLTADSGYSGTVANSGIVRAYLGADTVYTSEETEPSVIIIGPENGRIGSRINVGDVDGDDDPDLVVGAQGSGTDRGAIHIYLGEDNIWSPGGFGEPSKSIDGYVDSGRFGFSLAADADVDGDGIDDILVGAYGADRAHLYLSGSGYLDQDVPSVIDIVGELDSQLGVSVVFSESIEPDVFADAIIGGNRLSIDETDQGHIKIYRGSEVGLEEIEEFRGTVDSHFGYSVADLGDIDGDGREEILVGAPEITASNTTGSVFILSAAAELTDTDTDLDWVGDALDNCINDANTSQLDTDMDTQGDACDPNDDNDLLADLDDNCPLHANNDQLDTDEDTVGNVCDDDDDDDGVVDLDDDFPLLSEYQTDTDGDGLPDDYELEFGFDQNDASDGALDFDGDGLSNLDEFTQGDDPIVDDQAPVLTIPADILVNSTGLFTDVSVGQASAVDGLDGNVSVSASASSPFAPGRHEIVWTAVDAAGNEVLATQIVDVVPQVSLTSSWQQIPEGKQIKLFATLNGDAVSYPVSVSIAVAGTAMEIVDYELSDSLIEINEGSVGSVDLTVLEDTEDESDETILFSISEASNAVVADLEPHLVTISSDNTAPFVFSELFQDGDRRTTFIRDDGLVQLVITARELDDSDTLSIDISSPGITLIVADSEQDADNGSDTPSEEEPTDIGPETSLTGSTVEWRYLFDPFEIEEGKYTISYQVSDSGTPQNEVSVSHPIEIVINRPELLATSDTDNDGVSDAGEGILDTNQNGVSDYLEADVDGIDDQNRIPTVTGARRPLQTEPHLRLRLGQTSFNSGYDAAVDLVDISLYGGSGEVAENVDDDQYTYPYGIFDFEVEGLGAQEATARVVIPLDTALPARAVYRKYLSDIGWQDYTIDSLNLVASAPGSARACPPPGDSSYREGLNEGDYCIQLTIEDGGLNDADMERNGTIVDPSGVAVEVDADSDGVGDSIDNCPAIANSGQADADSDGLGDVCDSTPNGSGGSGSGGGGSGGESSGGGGGGSTSPILLFLLLSTILARRARRVKVR